MKTKAVSGIMLTLFLMLTLSTVLVKPMVATYPFEDIFKKDLLDLADGTPKIESIYIKSWMDTRPSATLWAFIRINYTAGLSDHEKISVQDYVQRQLESKWYIDIVEPNYYCVIFIYPTPPVPWPGFVIGDLNVGFKSVTVGSNVVVSNGFVLETDKAVYACGEPVNITFTNYSNETVELGSWPSFEIYDSQGDYVAPTIRAFCCPMVSPQESYSWTWDQRTSNSTEVPAGNYTVMLLFRDTVTWTWMTLYLGFEIVGPIPAAVDTIAPIIPPEPEYPAIYVDPPIVENIMPGNNVTVSIKTNYTGLISAYQFTLSYNVSVLHGINVTNGDIITTAKDPTAIFLPGTFDNTEGMLSLTVAFIFIFDGPIPSVWGPGTLANVTFTVVGYGTSKITLGPETRLWGWPPHPWEDPPIILDAESMPDHIGHGFFSNKIPRTMADAGPDQTVDEDTLVTFDGSASWDNVGIESYTWTFTDVTPQTLSGENPIYNFTTAGTYIVTLTVEDAAGNTDSDTVTITVLFDTDGDETPDVTDPDDDNDGTNDDEDAFPLDPTEKVDADGDGTGNNADPDDDNDGMPDTWETENELNPLDAADASLDPDGDGLTNLQEYHGDTNPNVSDAEAFPWWTLGAIAAVIIGIVAAAIAILWRRRK